MRIGIIFVCCLLLHLFSCQKEQFNDQSDASLNFSADTITFDTVFTTTRTVTKRLMVYNPYDESIRIKSVQLALADNSPFVLNINGETGKYFENISIRPKDSLYVFIQSFHHENGQDLPLFIKDSILFEINRNVQNIKVTAYSQDAYVFKDSVIKTQIWTGLKPYHIFGTLTIDTLEQLTINPGVVIYMHNGANIRVKGRIFAEGTFDLPVIIQGDRLDKDYYDIPGQWGGIYINPSNDYHRLVWTIIKNGTTGLQLGNRYNLTPQPSIELKNVVIQNMSYGGLLAYHTRIDAANCLIANAKKYTCYLAAGGQYQFYHSTIANYYSIYDYREFNTPTLYISNFEIDTTNVPVIFDLKNTFFRNSIIYGNFRNELLVDHKTEKEFNLSFDHCLIKGEKTDPPESYYIQCIWNEDPEFKDYEKLNFELDTLSSAKDVGAPEWGDLYPSDLMNKSRLSDGHPDLGAYERFE